MRLDSQMNLEFLWNLSRLILSKHAIGLWPIPTEEERLKTFFAGFKKEYEMNWDIVAGNWSQFKGKVKSQWGKLTDDQLKVIGGKRDVLSGKIQEAYGISKDEADKQVRQFEDLNKDYRPKSPS